VALGTAEYLSHTLVAVPLDIARRDPAPELPATLPPDCDSRSDRHAPKRTVMPNRVTPRQPRSISKAWIPAKELVTADPRKGDFIPVLRSGARHHVGVDDVKDRLNHRLES